MTNRQKVYTHCDSVLVLTALINHTYMQVYTAVCYVHDPYDSDPATCIATVVTELVLLD